MLFGGGGGGHFVKGNLKRKQKIFFVDIKNKAKISVFLFFGTGSAIFLVFFLNPEIQFCIGKFRYRPLIISSIKGGEHSANKLYWLATFLYVLKPALFILMFELF